jgi:polar amino acid transport system substrate-binding protein
MRTANRTATSISLVVLILASGLLACTPAHPGGSGAAPAASTSPESVLDRVRKDKTLRIGFSGYPPFLFVDPNTNLPSGGFSVELIQAILKEWDPSIKIEWRETNWTTVRTDLIAKKFDLIVEPVFRTIPRAAIVDFSRPFASFGYAIGVVQAGDTRFKSIEDINRPNVRIAVVQGLTSHEYAMRHLPKATNLKVVPGGQADAALNEVLLRRVDIALSDSTVIDQFLKAHPGVLKVVFDNPPPAHVTASMMFRQGDYKFASFLNTALDYLDGSGELRRLREKYGVR